MTSMRVFVQLHYCSSMFSSLFSPMQPAIHPSGRNAARLCCYCFVRHRPDSGNCHGVLLVAVRRPVIRYLASGGLSDRLPRTHALTGRATNLELSMTRIGGCILLNYERSLEALYYFLTANRLSLWSQRSGT